MPEQIRPPHVSLIVARSSPGEVIGLDNKLPWRLKSDLRRLKQITSGHAVIMGRKTFESIGRPLPARANIVLSRLPSADGLAETGSANETELYHATTLEEALQLANEASARRNVEEIFVLGGQEIYDLFLNADLVEKVYLTEIFADVPGDAHFHVHFPHEQWTLISSEDIDKIAVQDEYNSRFSIYRKKK